MQEKSSLEFSERLRQAMVDQGVKAARLASESGISKGYLSELLKAKKATPSYEVVKKFSSVLNCSPRWLLDGDVFSPEKTGVNFVPHGTKLKGSDAESSGSPKEIEDGSNELLPVLLRIADALEALVEIQNRPRTSSEVRGEKSA